MNFSMSKMLYSALVLAALLLAACGGGGGTAAPAAAPAAAKTTLMGGAMQGAPLSLASASAVVSTFAGSGVVGSANGTGTAATFNGPANTTTDGTNLYVADSGNNTIRKIVIATGAVTTLAGQAGVSGATDGAGTAATFNYPSGITTDGTNLYVVDTRNNKIRQIVIATGVVTSLTGTANTAMASGAADGAGTAATFNFLFGITTDGTNLYVADANNNKIRRIAPASGTLANMTSANAQVSSLTGTANTAMASGAADGAGTAASFFYPTSLTTDGTNLYVADASNQKIRRIAPASGTLANMTSANAQVSSLTGTANTAMAVGAADGAAATASFFYPFELVGLTTDGTNLYVVDGGNNKIRQIVIATGVVSSLTGVANTAGAAGAADGAAAAASFNNPNDITTDGSSLYVVDESNNKIRKIQ